ncbi:V-type ATP synthase subunit A, partial [Candidatus Gribaldobacteria bacterium]|nr:V-type ATP synthase subunit A [Candidatus Gribaldobacteria bacterium]
NWLTSYSLYDENLKDFFRKNGGDDFPSIKNKAMEILQKEAELEEIVRLVGVEALSENDQFLLAIAKMIREDFLHQNAFLEIDSYTSLKKQFFILKEIISLYVRGLKEIEQGRALPDILTAEIKEKVSKFKLVPEDKLDQINL